MSQHPVLFRLPMVRAILENRKTQMRCILTPRNTTIDGGRYGGERAWEKLDWNTAEFKGKSNLDVAIAGYKGAPDDPHLLVKHKEDDAWHRVRMKYEVFDVLWVRETFWQVSSYPSSLTGDSEPESYWGDLLYYAADGDPPNTPNRHYPNGLQEGSISAPDPWASWHKRSSTHMTFKQSRIFLSVKSIREERLQSLSVADVVAEGIKHLDMGERGRYYAIDPGHIYSDPFMAMERLWDWHNGQGSWASNPWVGVVEFERMTQ